MNGPLQSAKHVQPLSDAFRRPRISAINADKLSSKVKVKGLTLIPLRLYFKNGRVKVELGLCRGKKHHDKRDSIRDREVQREMDRATRQSR